MNIEASHKLMLILACVEMCVAPDPSRILELLLIASSPGFRILMRTQKVDYDCHSLSQQTKQTNSAHHSATDVQPHVEARAREDDVL